MQVIFILLPFELFKSQSIKKKLNKKKTHQHA
jgi:hypothetical protein